MLLSQLSDSRGAKMTEMVDEPMGEPSTAGPRDVGNTAGQAVALPARRLPLLPLGIGAGVLAILAIGALMLWRADARTNKVALSSLPKGVTVVAARAAKFRARRTYIGSIEPWIAASIGPQFISAFVETVLVRPGAVVKRGQVLATLDCRNASAVTQAAAMQARALDAEQVALAHQAARVSEMAQNSFASLDEAEQKSARSAAQAAAVLASRAQLMSRSLEERDCVQRAPFDGEIESRSIDPGAFVRPGAAIVSMIDRRIVRISTDVPEGDFGFVPPGTPVRIHMLATSKDEQGLITRRAPGADASTRTVHIEIDLDDPARRWPVRTTAELSIDVGQPVTATELPLFAASLRGGKASLFVVEGETARLLTVPVVGEASGRLFVDPALKPGAWVVTEGRALLHDGDKVAARLDASDEPTAPAAPSARDPEKPGVAPAEPARP